MERVWNKYSLSSSPLPSSPLVSSPFLCWPFFCSHPLLSSPLLSVPLLSSALLSSPLPCSGGSTCACYYEDCFEESASRRLPRGGCLMIASRRLPRGGLVAQADSRGCLGHRLFDTDHFGARRVCNARLGRGMEFGLEGGGVLRLTHMLSALDLCIHFAFCFSARNRHWSRNVRIISLRG